MLSYQRDLGRRRRQKRVRKVLLGTDDRPRVCVFRSLKHIYAQVISDDRSTTLAAVSTLSKEISEQKEKAKGVERARRVGALLAQVCKEKGIKNVVFDRNGFLYHGRIKALAEAAREGGLNF